MMQNQWIVAQHAVRPEELATAIHQATLVPHQISAKPSASRLIRMMCQSVCLDYASLSPAMLFSGVMPENCYTLVFVTKCPQTGRSFNFGIEHKDGYMGFFPPGGIIDAYTPEGYENAMLTVSAAVFLSAVERAYPEMPEALLKNGAGLRIGAEEQVRLRELLRAVLSISENPIHPEFCQFVRSQLEADLLSAFLSALADGGIFANNKPKLRAERRQRKLRQARDYITENCHIPVRLEDLCLELDMSKRGVELLFQDLLGVGPNAFIRNQRLHGVRKALLLADAAPGIVKHTAYTWGFWHLGHFSRGYQSLFGELPTTTLLRYR